MVRANVVARLIFVLFTASGAAGAGPLKPVRAIDDLPRFTYPLKASVADVLTMPPPQFSAVVRPMRNDIDALLAGYDIIDQATLRTLLSARLGIEIASGLEDRAALATVLAIRSHQDKEEARLVSGLAPQAFLEARLAVHDAPGVCPRDFSTNYARHLDTLPWAVVGVGQTRLRGLAQVARPSFLIGMVAQEVQPALDSSHALSGQEAWTLLAARVNLDVISVCREQVAAVLNAYVARHKTAKTDIWAARDVVLPPSRPLAPVAVAIWDSGVDTALFPGRLLLDSAGMPCAGPAFDVESRPTTDVFIPLNAEQHAAYRETVVDQDGISDLQSGIDSPAASAVRQKLAGMTPAQAQAFVQMADVLESYMHGTHVAGIAAAGNPAIRLSSALMTYDTKPVPTPPTEALQQRLAASYGATVAWFRAHGIRVVNMSWWNRPSNYEDVLQKNGLGKDPAERRRLARHYFDIERDGLYAALKGAPEVLFVTIAGNNNSDNAFEETIPSSFRLPNLLVVGAVDQAGSQTNFTSTGQNIGVYADGYEVASVVPGGATVRMSGTSMAAPAVTNLAAKLLAIDPKLTPTQLITIIRETSDAGEVPGIVRINPKQAIAALEHEAK